MRQLLLCAALVLLPALAMASQPSHADYVASIEAQWPHAQLREEQRQWLAQRSVQALENCHQSGRDLAWCQQLVREGLREMLGSEPVSSTAANSW
ncbi:MAG: hypothetical protein ACSHXK_02060 [Oceanococcus sp.]